MMGGEGAEVGACGLAWELLVHDAPGEALEGAGRRLGHGPGTAHLRDRPAERAIALGELAAGGDPVDRGDAGIGEEAGDHVGHRRILTWRATWASRWPAAAIARWCRWDCSAGGCPGSSPGSRRSAPVAPGLAWR